MKKAFKIIGVILWFLALIFLLILAFAIDDVTGLGRGMLLGYLWITAAIYCFTVVLPRRRRKNNLQKEAAVAAGARVAFCKGRCVAGLPVQPNTPCEVEAYTSNVSIFCTGSSYTLPMSRIVNATRYNDYEIRQYQKTSLGRTLLGGLAFGDVGAIIGSMPQTRSSKEVSANYLLIDYLSEQGEPKQLLILLETWVVNEDIVAAINKYRRGSVTSSPEVL